MEKTFHIEAIHIKDTDKLTDLARTTFLESHGHSASEQDIQNYISKHLNEEKFKTELLEPKNHFHSLSIEQEWAGYSKVIFNSDYKDLIKGEYTKMERLYILKEHYDRKLGRDLMLFNIQLAKRNNQKGIWLYTWTENFRAIDFYDSFGFKIVDATEFKISEYHSNPNHIMLLVF